MDRTGGTRTALRFATDGMNGACREKVMGGAMESKKRGRLKEEEKKGREDDGGCTRWILS